MQKRKITEKKENIKISGFNDLIRWIKSNHKRALIITITIVAGLSLCIYGIQHHNNQKVLDSYSKVSTKSAINLKKLKLPALAKTYPSDIDSVKMVSPSELNNYRSKSLDDGYGDNYAGYVSVPQIGLYLPILKGVNMYTLSLGAAAYYPTSTSIGGAGNYVLAGHNMNTSANVLFSRIPNIRIGRNSEIILTDKVKNYYYHVTEKKLVRPYQPVIKGTNTPTSKSVLYNDKTKKQVTLFTCNSNGTRRWVIIGQYDFETHH
ncbi:class A sortase [Bombilactobacillus bombi]|uniref:class A sortase n=1 Tax=Bombilactobacillus bombi TaxID=1303590 RepID=UPI0035EC1BE3